MIKLETERLIIRDPSPSDLAAWHKLLSDPIVMYYLQDIKTNSIEESETNLKDAVSEATSENRTKYFLVIELKETFAFVGSIGYTVTQETPSGKFAHIGYFILENYHNHGYVTEALKEVIRFAFEDDDVYRLETGCFAENLASEQVMKKCGMIKEAERKSCIWHEGKLKDRVEYRLLKDEWEKIACEPGQSK